MCLHAYCLRELVAHRMKLDTVPFLSTGWLGVTAEIVQWCLSPTSLLQK